MDQVVFDLEGRPRNADALSSSTWTLWSEAWQGWTCGLEGALCWISGGQTDRRAGFAQGKISGPIWKGWGAMKKGEVWPAAVRALAAHFPSPAVLTDVSPGPNMVPGTGTPHEQSLKRHVDTRTRGG